MLSASLLLTVVLSQYSRSHVDLGDPSSQCVWWVEDSVITYRQGAAGNPETPGETEFAAVAAAFATWNTQLERCGSLRLVEGPRTQSRAVGYDAKSASNENVVLFRLTDCDDVVPAGNACLAKGTCGDTFDCWEHANGALALTTTSYNPDTGRIYDSDIELNTRRFIFTTVDSPPCVSPNFNTSCVASDVQNTITHEAGHLLGLTHFNVAGGTMNAQANPGELIKRTLDDGSKQFICDVYPAGRPAKTCLLPAYDGELGKPKPGGCAAAPGLGWLAVGLYGLRRRRRT